MIRRPFRLRKDKRRRTLAPIVPAALVVPANTILNAPEKLPIALDISPDEKTFQYELIDAVTAHYQNVFTHNALTARRTADAAPTNVTHKAFFERNARSLSSYHRYAQMLAAHRRYDEFAQITRLMNADGVAPDTDMFVRTIRALANAPRVDAINKQRKQQLAATVAALYQEASDNGVSLNQRLLNAVTHAFASLHALSAAVDSLTNFAKHKLAPDQVTFTAMLRLYDHPDVTFEQLRCWWLSLQQSSPRVDTVAYNAMIEASAHHGQVEHAMMLRTHMKQDNCGMTMETFTNLIRACAHAPDFYDTALQLYQEACAHGEPVTALANSLMHVCATNHDLSTALLLFEAMAARKIERDVISYNTLIAAIAATQTQVKYELTSFAQETTKSVTVSQNERIEMTRRLIRQMRDSGLRADDNTRTAVLRVYAKTNRIVTTESAYQQLFTATTEPLKPETKFAADCVMLDLFIRTQRLSAALRLIQTMRADGQTPLPRHYTSALRLCARKSDETSGLSVLESMKADNIVAADRWTTLFDRERFRQHIRALPIEKQKHRRFIPKSKLSQDNLIQAWTRAKNRRKNIAYKQQGAMAAAE